MDLDGDLNLDSHATADVLGVPAVKGNVHVQVQVKDHVKVKVHRQLT